jgi:hypothetical protein
MNFRIKPVVFHTGVPPRKAPVARGGVRIAAYLPGRHLPDEGCLGTDAPRQTLATEHAKLYFGRVQPTVMFGRVMKLQEGEEAVSFREQKGGDKEART